jgi:hypothetical protein
VTAPADRIAEALRRVDEVGPDEAVYRRAQAGPRGGEPPREPGGRARLVAGVTAFAVFTAAALFAWNAFRPETRSMGPPKPRPTPTDLAQITKIDGWQVEVSVTPQQVGPIAISVGPAEPAPANDAHPWFQHDLVFENTGDRRVTFGDTRTSRFIGPSGQHRLIAADKGCGYGINGSGRVHPGTCLLYLDTISLDPGRSETRQVATFQGLPGMAPIRSGTYVFPRKILFDFGNGVPAGEGLGATLHITYRITKTPGAIATIPPCVDSGLHLSPATGSDEAIPSRPYGMGIYVAIRTRDAQPCRLDAHIAIQLRNRDGETIPVAGDTSLHLSYVVQDHGSLTGRVYGWRLADWCPALTNLPISAALYLDGRFVRVDRVPKLDSCTERPNIAQGGPRRRGTGSPSMTRLP